MEGRIFGEAYVRREICVSKSIRLAYSGKEIYHFCFVLLSIRAKFHVQAPQGAYIRRGDLTEGFLRNDLEGLIHGGAYFRNFTGNFFTQLVNEPLENVIFWTLWLRHLLSLYAS